MEENVDGIVPASLPQYSLVVALARPSFECEQRMYVTVTAAQTNR
jgi:hypothetical protein